MPNIEDALFKAFSEGKDSNELLTAMAKAEQRWKQEEEKKRIEEAKRVEAEAKAKEERAKRIADIANRAINGELTREDMDYMDKLYGEQFGVKHHISIDSNNLTPEQKNVVDNFANFVDGFFGLQRKK